MTTWSVGSIPFNIQAKVERYEDLAIMIQATRIGYAKAFKGAWNERDQKNASNEIMQQKEIGLVT
jgi:hypothetical protein